MGEGWRVRSKTRRKAELEEEEEEEMQSVWRQMGGGVKRLRGRGQESSIMDGSGVKEGQGLLRFIPPYWKVTSGRESGK